MKTSIKKIKSYVELRGAVAKTFLESQREIDALKVKTYWKTGELIKRHLKQFPNQVKHTGPLLTRLAKDLNMEPSIFYRILKFYESYPGSLATWPNLTWSHYRELIAIPEKSRRLEFAKKANAEAWPVRVLQERIQSKAKMKVDSRFRGDDKQLRGPVESKRGKPGAVRVGWLENSKGMKQAVLDFGFQMYFEESSTKLKGFKQGNWVRKRRGKWERAENPEDFYFYEAELERVVDGDTLLVQVRLPNRMKRRQYLRLVGYDAPSLKTKAGAVARAKLQKFFYKETALYFKSRFRDRYGRSLADVWVGNLYLNREML